MCVKEVVKLEVGRERGIVSMIESLPTSAGAAVRAARRVGCSESTGDWCVGWGVVLCECAPCADALTIALPAPTLRMRCVLCNSVV